MTETETLEQVIAERDALRAEVERLRAAMPKWTKVPWIEGRWELQLPYNGSRIDVCVNSKGWWHQHQSDHTPEYESRDAAMRAAEAWAGLPQCEVVE